MEFGQLIKKLREEKGITQKELGVMIGLSDATMSKIENGIRTPDIPLLEKLAPALGVPYSRLFFYEKEEELSSNEKDIIHWYRTNPSFKAGVDSLLVALNIEKKSEDNGTSSRMA